jgi:hypothetical protein
MTLRNPPRPTSAGVFGGVNLTGFAKPGQPALEGEIQGGHCCLREYLCNRLTEATRVLSEDSSRLAEVLIEILAAATGDAEIVGWCFPAPEIPRGMHTGRGLRDAACTAGNKSLREAPAHKAKTSGSSRESSGGPTGGSSEYHSSKHKS